MKINLNKNISGAGILVIAMMATNIFNFIFNAYLGRELSFEDYAVITVMANLWLIISVFINALSATVNNRTAFLATKYAPSASLNFLSYISKKTILISIILTVIWILCIPLFIKFFHIDQWAIFLSFSPIIIFGCFVSINRGFLQGNLLFSVVAILLAVESISKLLIAIVLVNLHLNSYTYLAVPISIGLACIISFYYLFRSKIKKDDTLKLEKEKFPTGFMLAALLFGLSSTIFLTVDVLLAKHFLSTREAGQYALISLVGKMIFFLGSLVTSFMITLVSRNEGKGLNSNSLFYKFFGITAFLVINAFVFLGPLGNIFVPILFGDKAREVSVYLTNYSLGIVLFTLSNVIMTYHLSKKHYVFPIVGVIISAMMAVGILVFHENIKQIVYVVLIASFIGFLIFIALHFLYNQGRFVLRNIIDGLDLFMPLEKFEKKDKSKKSILIFNWRDTKHKYAGGAEVYVHELAKRWAEDGNKVTLFCGNDSESKRYEVIDGVEVIRRGGFYFVYMWAFFYYLFKFRGKYDVILDCQNGIPFFTPLYAKEKVYCIIFHIHQDVFQKYLWKPFALLAKTLEKKLMPWAYRNSVYLTISESTKTDMRNMGLDSEDIPVIYPGVDLKNYSPGIKHSDPTILYLGRLKQYKSVDVLIKAFPQILKSVPNAKLVIAGTGEEEENLKKLANELGILEKVNFKGKVTDEDKIQLMQEAWVFVNPSMMEGWGITTIEANACGTPVVAADVPGLRDSVKHSHTGFLVPYGEHKAFADKIIKMLKKHHMRKSMAQKAVEWAENFDWIKSANKFYELM